MKTKMFAVYDTKAECYNTPFFMLNEGMAKRAFEDMANDERTTVNKHPKDYILYMLGEFDDVSGVVESDKPVNLGFAPNGELKMLGKKLIEEAKLAN